MGSILFIRVSAVTYKEEDVPKAWPALYALAFEAPDRPIPLGAPRGVLELISTLDDLYNFGSLPAPLTQAMAPYITTLHAAIKNLNSLLANRNAQKAYEVTNDIEATLSSMEATIRDIPSAR